MKITVQKKSGEIVIYGKAKEIVWPTDKDPQLAVTPENPATVYVIEPNANASGYRAPAFDSGGREVIGVSHIETIRVSV